MGALEAKSKGLVYSFGTFLRKSSLTTAMQKLKIFLKLHFWSFQNPLSQGLVPWPGRLRLTMDGSCVSAAVTSPCHPLTFALPCSFLLLLANFLSLLLLVTSHVISAHLPPHVVQNLCQFTFEVGTIVLHICPVSYRRYTS